MRRSSPSQSRDGGRIVQQTSRKQRLVGTGLHSASLHTESMSVLLLCIGAVSAIAAVLPIKTAQSVPTRQICPINRHNRHNLAQIGLSPCPFALCHYSGVLSSRASTTAVRIQWIDWATDVAVIETCKVRPVNPRSVGVEDVSCHRSQISSKMDRTLGDQ